MSAAMNIIGKIAILLCMWLSGYQLHAQENLDLKGTSCIPVMSVTEDSLAFKAGEKIAQLVLLPIITPDLEVVDSLEDTERGSNGFGSTGR